MCLFINELSSFQKFSFLYISVWENEKNLRVRFFIFFKIYRLDFYRLLRNGSLDHYHTMPSKVQSSPNSSLSDDKVLVGTQLFLQDPIPTSLLKLNVVDLASQATNLFQIILKYMGINSSNRVTPLSLEKRIELIGKLYELRDELFIQISKQKRNNPYRYVNFFSIEYDALDFLGLLA